MASGLAPFGAMPRIDYICANGLFRRHLGNIAQLESGRIFCRHGIDHLLDVARIMWIKNLEEELEFDREVIYATALLHDIGKDEQYESGIPHDVASERVADAILGGMPDDVAFEPADAAAIKTAILGHRKLRVNSQPLERLLYAADKMCIRDRLMRMLVDNVEVARRTDGAGTRVQMVKLFSGALESCA